MSDELARPGQIIDGKYRIVRLLGSGGMGAVYEGENLRIRRRVAIKMLHASVSGQADIVTRFEREAQAAALVGSEHICEVLDVGELPDHSRFMVMEYLEGETLSSLIKRHGRLPPERAVPIVCQVLEGLTAAHAAGIIHRDLKPDNVVVLPRRGSVTNFAKILDFGVSKFTQGEGAMNVTRAGAVVGTPYYMSPEQARASSAVDQRTDIYALGVVLYQASTGSVPFQAANFAELLLKIVLDPPTHPSLYAPELPPALIAIILKAMARDPNDRYGTAAEFSAALRAFLPEQLLGTSGASLQEDPRISLLGISGSGLSSSGSVLTPAPTTNPGIPSARSLHPGVPQATTANSWADGSHAPRASGKPGTKIIVAALAGAVSIGTLTAVLASGAFRGGATAPAARPIASVALATDGARVPAAPLPAPAQTANPAPVATASAATPPTPSAIEPAPASASPLVASPSPSSTGPGPRRLPGPMPGKAKPAATAAPGTTDLGY